jgi:hypothetical protein
MSHPQELKPRLFFLASYRGPEGPLFHENTLGGTAEAEPFHEGFSTKHSSTSISPPASFDKQLSTSTFPRAPFDKHLFQIR